MKTWLHKLFLVVGLLLVSLSVQADGYSAALQALLDAAVDENGPAVALQVTSPVDMWGSTPASPEDRFRIGSMSKTFVAVVALQLASEGVFSLDDPARNWLSPALVANIANAEQVTLRQLLSMRSGIDDYLSTEGFWEVVDTQPDHTWTAAEALKFAYGVPPLFPPDRLYHYSNTNYLLLQLVLESATGQPLHTLVRDRILDPLGMENTFSQVVEDSPAFYLHGYEDFDGDGVLEDVTAIDDGMGLADGALISTTNDLTIFYQALLQEQTLLDEDMMQELLNFGAEEDDWRYSLGLASWDTEWGTAIGHDGSVLGFVSIGAYFPESETIVITLCASADCDMWSLAEEALMVFD
jgi:D-alanyl-D-alanine carboxypeptidase